MKLVVLKKVSCRAPFSDLKKITNKTISKFGKEHKNSLSQIEEISLALVGESEMKKLNKQYRGKNKPTDVLSFDYGEIIICVPVATAQAKIHKLSLAKEINLLFTHGLLHVLGFDHEKPKDNKEMREAEQAILGYSGLINLSQNV